MLAKIVAGLTHFSLALLRESYGVVTLFKDKKNQARGTTLLQLGETIQIFTQSALYRQYQSSLKLKLTIIFFSKCVDLVPK